MDWNMLFSFLGFGIFIAGFLLVVRVGKPWWQWVGFVFLIAGLIILSVTEKAYESSKSVLKHSCDVKIESNK